MFRSGTETLLRRYHRRPATATSLHSARYAFSDLPPRRQGGRQGPPRLIGSERSSAGNEIASARCPSARSEPISNWRPLASVLASWRLNPRTSWREDPRNRVGALWTRAAAEVVGARDVVEALDHGGLAF